MGRIEELQREKRGSREAGFSLVEMMLALMLGTAVLGALLAGLHQTQLWGGNMARLARRDANLHLAPLLLSRWISSAGNNCSAAVEIQSGVLTLHADLSGADEGFPDGSLDDPFESLSLRLQEGKLQLRSGSGSFQSVLEPIESLQALLETPRLLRIRLEAVTDGVLAGVGQKHSQAAEISLALPNRRPNLFEEED